jgi:hypothetical protein
VEEPSTTVGFFKLLDPGAAADTRHKPEVLGITLQIGVHVFAAGIHGRALRMV